VTLRFVEQRDLTALLRGLCAARTVYYPQQTDDGYRLARSREEEAFLAPFSQYRVTQPMKVLFFPPRERIDEDPPAPEKLAIIGAKACDVGSIQNLDTVFLQGEFEDPFYASVRHNALIISSDCTGFRESCFCTRLGVPPYPTAGFDLNLSPVSGGFVVEIGSDQGADLAGTMSCLHEASEDQVQERDANRKDMAERVAADRASRWEKDWDVRDATAANLESDIWQDRAARCVECGGCNLACPNCFCFMVSDRPAGDWFERRRLWDSCQYKGYAKIAAGYTRARLAQRVRNRFIHKFLYTKDNYGVYGCFGCGRCTEVCLAKIDIREVLEDLLDAKPV